MNRPLPSDVDAERTILGAVLIDNSLIAQAAEKLGPSDFYNPAHRRVYGAMLSLFETSKKIEPIAIGNLLKKDGPIDSIGGVASITNYTHGIPHYTNIGEHVDIVKKHAVLRDALRLASRFVDNPPNSKDALEVLGDFRSDLADLDEGRNLAGFAPLRTVTMDSVEAKAVDWLWEPYFARGAFTIIDGEEGIGKTFLICKIAADRSAGRLLPGETVPRPPGRIVLISAEDSLSFVIKPRLDRMEADCSRIVAIEEPFALNAEGIRKLSFVLAEQEPELVFIDPLFSYAGEINLNRDSEVRSVTDALNRLAEKHHCSIVGLRHIGKSKGFGDARNAGLNGVGWRAGARTALLIGKNPQNDKDRAMVQTKSNLGPVNSQSLGFVIDDGECRWNGVSELTANAMLAFHQTESIEEKGEKADAKSFLLDFLRDGPQGSRYVIDAANQAGISKRTLDRAKSELQVSSKKDSTLNGGWSWQLPEKPEVCHTNTIGNLRLTSLDKSLSSNGLSEVRQDCQETHLESSDNLRGNVRE